MAHVVEMPKLSDTMTEGGVSSWLIKEGESVSEGDALLEIETDKATMEYYSPYEGTLLKILVEEGQTCDLSSPIAIVGEKGESYNLDQLISSNKSAETKVASNKPEEKEASSSESNKSSLPVLESKAAIDSTQGKTDRLKASPLAKKVASENGLDLSNISGTGPLGRVVVKDVELALSNSSNSTPEPSSSHSSEINSATGNGRFTDSTVSMMRKTIANRLLTAKNEAPHFYLTIAINMEKSLAWRGELNKDFDKSREGAVKVSVNDIIVLACSRALLKHKIVNSSWQKDFIRTFDDVHVAIAVALPEGLITPVIRETHCLGVRDISRQVKDLALKAKEGKLTPEEYTGGTFTISNLGMFDIEEFTAIINPPQAAILAAGTTKKVPAVNEGGELTVQSQMKVTLSCDHRVVDGAEGAKFLKTLKDFLENPMNMLS